MIALALACGISIRDWDNLTLGQIAEVILAKNNYEKEAYEGTAEQEPAIRVATQADWDRLGG